VTMSLRFEPPLTLTSERLTETSSRLVEAVERELGRIAEAAANRAALKTPGKHAHKAWVVRSFKGEDGARGFVVENTDPRFNASVELSDGRITNLGEMLEYGTRPHMIRAKPGGVLAFFWPAVGRFVTVASVAHPGTKPYGMMRAAHGLAVAEAQNIGAVVARAVGATAGAAS
jgi:hypothetical protein